MNCFIMTLMIICLLVYVFNVQPATQDWVCVGGVQAADQFPPIAMDTLSRAGTCLWYV